MGRGLLLLLLSRLMGPEVDVEGWLPFELQPTSSLDECCGAGVNSSPHFSPKRPSHFPHPAVPTHPPTHVSPHALTSHPPVTSHPCSTNQPPSHPPSLHPRPQTPCHSYLGRDVVHHAGIALKDCLTAVTPRVMTWRQYGEAAYNTFEKVVLGRDVDSYVPDFTASTVKHFAIHAGGWARSSSPSSPRP